MRSPRSNGRDEALAAYDAALAIEPDNAEALNNRSVVLVTLGRLDEALQSCERALARKAGLCRCALQSRQCFAGAWSRSKTRARATRRRSRSSRAAPMRSTISAWRWSGSGSTREALANFDAALALDPDHLGALHNRANALFELGSFEEALAALRQDPDDESSAR